MNQIRSSFNLYYIIIFIGLIPHLVSAQAYEQVEAVARFKGQQVTGVTVSVEGRVFANFPRWRKGVEHAVIEVMEDGSSKAFPNKQWNQWEIGDIAYDSVFVAVQSVVANGHKLFVLDTRNPEFKGVINTPRIFVFDLESNHLIDILLLDENSYKPNSYVNDLRVDTIKDLIYITDSNEPGLIVYNLKNRNSYRYLDNHFSTAAETNHLTINGEKWGGKPVHADGIAYNVKNERLYYHALTGYTLYSVSTQILGIGDTQKIEDDVRKEAETSAPDGMIFDSNGILYYADLEKNTINYRTLDGTVFVLAGGDKIKWADTFSIYNGYLYFTNSRINETKSGVEHMEFTINKIKI